MWMASDYLTRRGIEPSTSDTFLLGYVADPAPGHEKFQGFISIPYRGPFNKVTGKYDVLTIRFRCAGEHDGTCKERGHGKYATITGDHVRMFNVPAILEDDTDTISITEGELDAIILNQCGYPAVGLPGAQSWRSHHRRMVAGFTNVLIWADPDTAGGEMAAKLIEAVPRARLVNLLHDVNDTYLIGGREAIDAAYGEALWGTTKT